MDLDGKAEQLARDAGLKLEEMSEEQHARICSACVEVVRLLEETRAAAPVNGDGEALATAVMAAALVGCAVRISSTDRRATGQQIGAAFKLAGEAVEQGLMLDDLLLQMIKARKGSQLPN